MIHRLHRLKELDLGSEIIITRFEGYFFERPRITR